MRITWLTEPVPHTTNGNRGSRLVQSPEVGPSHGKTNYMICVRSERARRYLVSARLLSLGPRIFSVFPSYHWPGMSVWGPYGSR